MIVLSSNTEVQVYTFCISASTIVLSSNTVYTFCIPASMIVLSSNTEVNKYILFVFLPV